MSCDCQLIIKENDDDYDDENHRTMILLAYFLTISGSFELVEYSKKLERVHEPKKSLPAQPYAY